MVTLECIAVAWSPGRLWALQQRECVIAKLFCLLRHLWIAGSVPTCRVLRGRGAVTHWNRDGLTCYVLSQAGASADSVSQGEKSGQGIMPVLVGIWVKPRGLLEVVECHLYPGSCGGALGDLSVQSGALDSELESGNSGRNCLSKAETDLDLRALDRILG